MISRILASFLLIVGLLMCLTGFSGMGAQYLGLGLIIIGSAIYVAVEIRILRETLREVLLTNKPISSPTPPKPVPRQSDPIVSAQPPRTPAPRPSPPPEQPIRPLPPPGIVDLDAQDAAQFSAMRKP